VRAAGDNAVVVGIAVPASPCISGGRQSWPAFSARRQSASPSATLFVCGPRRFALRRSSMTGAERLVSAPPNRKGDGRLTTHPSQKRTFSDVRFCEVTRIGRVTVMGAKQT
jgi:hypothetical protein